MAAAPNPRGQFSRTQWARDLLTRLGLPVSPVNTVAVVAWELAEGGHFLNNAFYNPLNTTQAAPGATAVNSVGVRAYPDYETGMQATIATLNNGRYGAILAALKAGTSAAAIAQAIDASPWGTKAAESAVTMAGKEVAGTGPTPVGPGNPDPSGAANPEFVPGVPDNIPVISNLNDVYHLLTTAAAWVANRHNWIRLLEIAGGFVGVIVGVFLISDDLNVSSVANAARPVAEAAML